MTRAVYLEIKFKGRWQWAGTYYHKTFKECFKRALKAALVDFEEEPDDWRIKIGEPNEPH